MAAIVKTWEKTKKLFKLSLTLAKSDFKLKNEGSYLGVLWYLINPLLTFAVLFFIFSDRLGTEIQNYPLYLFLGIIIFKFFHQTTIESGTKIIHNPALIKSINFPQEILIFSTVLKNLFSHLIEIILLVPFLIIFKISWLEIIFYLPILILFCLFIYGFSLFLAAITTYFNDLENIWTPVSILVWFITPIFYAIEGQNRLFTLNLFNPIYYFISVSRDIIIYTKMPPGWMILGIIGYSLLSLLIGNIVFKKLKHKFAELI